MKPEAVPQAEGYFENAETAVQDELSRARRLHPDWPIDPVHAAAIVAEEAGELVRAVLRYVYEGKSILEVRTEAVQVGAMAARFIEHLDYYWPDKADQVRSPATRWELDHN